MAKRPVYIVETEGKSLVTTRMLEFEWFPGFSISQKQKSIRSLHNAVKACYPNIKTLEISTKSEFSLGVKLSAFNLMVLNSSNQPISSVECLFQSSKVFESPDGKILQFHDLLKVPSQEAKKDPRLKNSGRLIAFHPKGKEKWELKPLTAYYDWIYVNTLKQHEEYHKELQLYSAFTDIEFNPKKSINCQAYSVALFCSLFRRGCLNSVLHSKKKFLTIYRDFKVNNAKSSLL